MLFDYDPEPDVDVFDHFKDVSAGGGEREGVETHLKLRANDMVCMCVCMYVCMYVCM